MRWLAALALVLAAAQAGRTEPTGRITGVVVMPSGDKLPGATVTVRVAGSSSERNVVTDASGAFVIEGLAPGRYDLTARLAGFEGASHHDVTLAAGETRSLNFTLEPGCLSTVDYIDNGLAWVLAQTNVIAHIRVAERPDRVTCPPSFGRSQCACESYRAIVSKPLKGELGQTKVLRLIQDAADTRGWSGPYAPGDEFIAFLQLDVTSAAFKTVSGPLYTFPIRNGRVDLRGRALPGFKDGMTVEEFEEALKGVDLGVPASPGRHGGHISGAATDFSGAPMPGTTITLRWAEGERTVTTDNRGAFFFWDVPAGRYALVASLQGMHSLPHTDVVIGPRGRATIVFEFGTDCMRAPEPEIDAGLSGMMREADLVAHIRIPALVPQTACSLRTHCACTLHHTNVLRVIKGGPVPELRLIQEGAGYDGDERAYVAGDEFIALLKRDEHNHAYRRMIGPRYMFPVRNGRVIVAADHLPGLKDGMTVAEFEAALRATRGPM